MIQPRQAFFFQDFQSSYIPDILEEIYLKRVYEPYLLGKQNLTIVDAGANIGLASYYFRDFAQAVYAIEPAKTHQETINMLIEHNKIKNIVLCPYALSNTSGTTKFYHNKNVTMFSLSGAVNDKTDFEEVKTVTFDEFMEVNKLTHIDLLKLDVEGTECELVASDGFAKYASSIDTIIGEWHAWATCEKQQFANMFLDLEFSFRWMANTKASVFAATRI